MKRLLGIILLVLTEISFLSRFNNNFSDFILNPKAGSFSDLPLSGAKAGFSSSINPIMKIALPAPGNFYQGVYPGDITILDQSAGLSEINAYEQAAGKSVAWVYFSSEWGKDRKFPLSTVEMVYQLKKTPFIRLMLRTNLEQGHADQVFTLERIIRGDLTPTCVNGHAAPGSLAGPCWLNMAQKSMEIGFLGTANGIPDFRTMTE